MSNYHGHFDNLNWALCQRKLSLRSRPFSWHRSWILLCLSKCMSLTTVLLRKKKTHQDGLYSIMVHVTQNHVQLTESFPHDVHYSSFIKRYAMSLICFLFLCFFLQWHCTWITRSLQLWAGIKRVSTGLFVSPFALFFCFNFVIPPKSRKFHSVTSKP